VASDDPRQLSRALRFDPDSHHLSCKVASDLALDAASNCVPSEEMSGPARAAHSDHVPALARSGTQESRDLSPGLSATGGTAESDPAPSRVGSARGVTLP